MINYKHYLIILVCIQFFIGLSCIGLGDHKKFNGGKIYYKNPVTDVQVEKVGDILMKQGYFDGSKRRMQLLYDEQTGYQLKVAINNEKIDDSETIQFYKQLAREASRYDPIYSNGLILHLADNKLRTVKKIKISEPYGSELTLNKGEIFYKQPVTKEDAVKLGNYLVKEGFFDGTRKTVQLLKSGTEYTLRLVVKFGIQDDPIYYETVQQFQNNISKDVFNNHKLNIELCDIDFVTLRKVQTKEN